MNHATTLEADLLIVGAGPAGLYATFYAGMRELSVVVLDALPEVGGQLRALYPEKPIYDVAGLPAVTGAELVTALHKQSRAANPTWVLGERAETLARVATDTGERFAVTTDRGTCIRVGGVILTAGIGSFKPRRLTVADHLEGRGLHYGVTSAGDFASQDVVVVGGGDSAVDWANMLAPLASSVTVVHRRRTLTAHQASVNELVGHRVRVLLDSEILAVEGTERLERVHVGTRKSETRILQADAVIAALGHIADLGPLRDWGCGLEERRHIVVDRRMETTVPGVFAAGDVTTYEGKVRIMATGFGEAATAVNNLAARLRPGEAVFPGHSTDVMASTLHS
jgi:thioredoxin reductase (NADPH)